MEKKNSWNNLEREIEFSSNKNEVSVSEQFAKLIVNHFTNVNALVLGFYYYISYIQMWKSWKIIIGKFIFLETEKVRGFRLVNCEVWTANCELQTVNYFTTLVGNVWRFFLALHLTMRYFKNTIRPGFEMEHKIFMKYY